MSPIITSEEVHKHNDKKSVWIIIHNEVYDVTKFLDEHPGGEDSLLDYAGQDGTQAFEDVVHSEDARELMKKYKIGTLPQGERTQVSIPSCSRVPKGEEKTWRTFDGTPDRPKSPKMENKSTSPPKPERRVQSIVVPRDRASSSRLKWAILALAGAVIIGVVVKKYMT